MSKTLDVYLNNFLVGSLIQDNHGSMIFGYSEKWLRDAFAIPLSQSLPLRKEIFKTKECRGFFAGILPEQNKRKDIARILGVSAQNDFSLLEKIGGECAGAITFVPEGESLKTFDFQYQTIDTPQLANILRELPRRPLMAGEKDIRISLAGAQDKIAVCINEKGQMSIPLGTAISTHIIKPAIAHYEGIVFNEALCMRLANAIGLSSAKVEIGQAENIDYLLIERYDRRYDSIEGDAYIRRIHQEDFCQALGIPPENKYQHEGGPSLKQCFNLVRELSDAPVVDLQILLDYVIYNFLVGNCDAHGKNFSVLYDTGTRLSGRERRLAPLYDVLCTTYYPDISQKMAMKIGGEYSWNKILPERFEFLAEEIGFAKPLVKSRVIELTALVLEKIDQVNIEHTVALKVVQLIKRHCEDVLRDFKGTH